MVTCLNIILFLKHIVELEVYTILYRLLLVRRRTLLEANLLGHDMRNYIYN